MEPNQERSLNLSIFEKFRLKIRRKSNLVFFGILVIVAIQCINSDRLDSVFHSALTSTALLLLLLVGPGHFFYTGIKLFGLAVWIPLRATLKFIANNWEATIVLVSVIAIDLGRQKWTIFLTLLGFTFAYLALEFYEPFASYFSIAISIVIVLYRMIDQYAAHVGWNEILEKVAEVTEKQGTKPDQKPKLKRISVNGDALEDSNFSQVISKLVFCWVIDGTIAKIRRQSIKLIFHVLAVVSLLYSILVMAVAACIAAAGLSILLTDVDDKLNITSIAASLLKELFFAEQGNVLGLSIIATILKALIFLQILMFARTINETTKSGVDQFLRRMEKALLDLRSRKVAEITFEFGRSPEELATMVKKRGEKFGKMIDLLRDGHASEAVNLLERPKSIKSK